MCYINEILNTYFTIKGKSSGGSKGTTQSSKQDRKSPVKSPKPSGGKDHGDGDSEEQKSETAAPKVPPLKIVIPGGAGGSGNRNEQEGDGMLSNNPSVVTPHLVTDRISVVVRDLGGHIVCIGKILAAKISEVSLCYVDMRLSDKHRKYSTNAKP